jgi:hypothetical protein
MTKIIHNRLNAYLPQLSHISLPPDRLARSGGWLKLLQRKKDLLRRNGTTGRPAITGLTPSKSKEHHHASL